MSETLKPGDQIVFIPKAANNDISHPSVRFGFVVRVSRFSRRPDALTYFCRFWKNKDDDQPEPEIKATRCYDFRLYPYEIVEQAYVMRLLNARR